MPQVLQKANSCEQQVAIGSTLFVHYSIYVNGGNFKRSDKPELLETTMGKDTWNFVYEPQTDLIPGLRHGLAGFFKHDVHLIL